MGSLRDQLLRAGIATARDRKRVERELKEERRRKQGSREARAVIEAREDQERRRREEEARQHRIAERAARRAAEEDAARELQVTHLLRHHALSFGSGPQRFWHRTLEGTHCHRLDLPEWIALDLRAGRLGIGALPVYEDVDYVVIPREVAIRIRAIRPRRIVFWNDAPPPDDDPAQRLLESPKPVGHRTPATPSRTGGPSAP
ncbi:MAG: DUF2058 family protein [Deltaproteobacteria bacterium]|nr:DUF2058 family protein [Deltaproteobacteria bacterium]